MTMMIHKSLDHWALTKFTQNFALWRLPGHTRYTTLRWFIRLSMKIHKIVWGVKQHDRFSLSKPSDKLWERPKANFLLWIWATMASRGSCSTIHCWGSTNTLWTVQYQCSIPKKTISFFSKRSILSWCLPIHYKCGSNALLNNLIQCNHGQQYFDFDVKLKYCFNNLHKTDSHRHNEGSSVCLTSFSVWKRLNSWEGGARHQFFWTLSCKTHFLEDDDKVLLLFISCLFLVNLYQNLTLIYQRSVTNKDTEAIQ